MASQKSNIPIEKKEYKSYTLRNFRDIPQLTALTEEQKCVIEIVGTVLPFKTNNYITDELINWKDPLNDPIYRLTFPQKGMLKTADYKKIESLKTQNVPQDILQAAVDKIREKLNPHPAGQKDLNVPFHDNKRLKGVQHKYGQTVLFFPSQGQTCHAYCTFCFRWPQFVSLKDGKFAMKEIQELVAYVRDNEDISDVLITGGDPMIMKTSTLSSYINALLDAGIPHLKTIRIGTKALGFWPYRFLTDDDSEELLELFKKVRKDGKLLAIMAHFSHPHELSTPAVVKAIRAIRKTGAQIRTQSPVFKHINDSPDVWAKMWRKQVNLGCIPYYMFVARDTGAQHYFAVSLVEAWNIYRRAYRQVSGIARTVRGPSMSCSPGKILVLGVAETADEKVIILKFIQGRNYKWVGKPFFAAYNPSAIWIDDLKPAFGEDKFFFEDEMEEMNIKSLSDFNLSDY